MEAILIVDDDPGFRQVLKTPLAQEGYCVETVASVAEAMELGELVQFQLVLCDLQLPDGDGLDVLRWFSEYSPATSVIMITGYGTVASAIEAMKLGAEDYLVKPLASSDELRLLVRRTLERQRIVQERDLLREQDAGRQVCANTVETHDSRMAHVLELLKKIAPTNAAVLLRGETGAGKEMVARCIHQNSLRAGRVFVAVNCAALSPNLIETELCGHERAASSGSTAPHIGRFERAHGGTLFLDEISELDGSLQTKLLRVLQEKVCERVGGTRQIPVDVRIIAATHRDLQQAAQDGKFREDLYQRLSAFPIDVPPLRERPADIAALARFFLHRASANLGKPTLELTQDALDALAAYSWPGNVRELENMMERVAILCDGQVRARDLPISGSEPRPTHWRQIERRAIEDALSATHGNRTAAARQLGISLRKLQYRLKEYGVTEHRH